MPVDLRSESELDAELRSWLSFAAQKLDELQWLAAFLNARVAEMRTEAAHSDVTRVETAQRLFLRASNLDLNGPLSWRVYGDSYSTRSR